MNSIKQGECPNDQRTALTEFFRNQIVPAAQALKQRRVRFFPLYPDPAEPTWYVPYLAGTPDFQEFNEEMWATILREHWADQDLPELAALAGPLMELQKMFAEASPGAGEISPFIYVMF